MRPLAILVLLAAPLLASAVDAQDGAARAVETSRPITATGLAVAETGQGLVGTAAQIEAVAQRGDGSVFVDTQPLSETDMQASARLAARVAADTLGLDRRAYDVMITFRSGSPVIGGPSAGAVMTMAVTAALWSLEHPDDPWTVDRHVAATGTINLDGTIGPVGGIPAKAEGAARAGIHTVVYPAGQEQAARGDGSRVDMTSFCRDLGIRCIPAASVADLIRVAADRQVERPEPAVPGTAEFPQLADSVQDQMAQLASRLEAARQRAGPEPAREEVAEALATADVRLDEARVRVESGDYYLGATLSFRGLIQTRYAQALMDLHEGEPLRSDVEHHIEACAAAVEGIDAPDEAEDWTAFSAIAAAQQRVDLARDLLQQARGRMDAATTLQDWHGALLEASFCQERVDTVAWWASLPELFLPGEDLEEAEARSQDAIERAQDMVAYAHSVQGAAGSAARSLALAQAHHEGGRYPAAMLYAVQAEAAASVSLQAADGTVSEAVLAEALHGAARAVARARAEGNEPLLSVALIELSTIEDGSDALLDLWTARGLALLSTSATPSAPQVTLLAPAAEPPWPLLLAMAASIGLVLGIGGTLLLSPARRQP